MIEYNTIPITELQQRAEEGDAQAQFELALCYANGTDADRNAELALEWIRKAAEQGHINAQFALGLYYFLERSRNEQTSRIVNEYTRDKWIIKKSINPALDLGVGLAMSKKLTEANDDLAFEWFKKAAEQNHAEANYLLGQCYQNGIGAEQNNEIAFNCFRISAEQGMAESQYLLACCYFEGLGTAQNNELGMQWCENAAENGIAEAQYHLACQLLDGNGVVQDIERGLKYLQRAADQEIHHAEMRLAECYAQGFGVEKSDELAFQWYEKAAKEEIAEAQFEVAKRHFEGKGVDKSYANGMEWMIRAAGQGHAEANNWLINAYISLAIPSCLTDKEDAEQYYKFAVDWCLKELDGHNAAEANLLLGVLYYSGKGVEQSDECAIGYFERAEYMACNTHPDFDHNETIAAIASLYVGILYAQGKNILTVFSSEQNGFDQYKGHFHSFELQLFGEIFVDGIIAMPFHGLQTNKVFLTLLRISIYKKAGEYELAKEFIKEVFDKTDGMDKNFLEVCLTGIEQEQEISEKNKALESEIIQKEALYKALHEKEKEMLSFFTHTMRNALATAPESLRQAIHLLGGEVYEKDTNHYKAINKIASLFSTLSLTDCLIDTFKQSISDPQEFKQSWQKDHAGDATPKWVIASALRQSLNRIIFMSDTTELRKLLHNPETALIKATRKSFIEEVLPLNVDSHGVEVFYDWTLAHISAIDVSIADSDKINFGVNQIRFSLLFAITSELILNALKYWDGENRIQISWQLAEQDNYVFSIKNHCKANATSNLAGTHKGLAFIKRLMELLGEQAHFVCKSEGQLFIAELILNKALFDGG